jgi:hypothetical protein
MCNNHKKDPSVGAGGSLYINGSPELGSFYSPMIPTAFIGAILSVDSRVPLGGGSMHGRTLNTPLACLLVQHPAQFYTCMFCVVKGHVLLRKKCFFMSSLQVVVNP